ncbi:hypothetical protein [Lacticaseibacillus daqingensis]|uniref:hypothetical protein n=1 Tax=Lacticaseibacillus daqingensis TaxID=2486014 RepID=UPI001CDCEC8C|nr:hypothetical protein [Lacticaseibacillus daqingensis]
MKSSYETLNNSRWLNLIWLLLIIASASFGILAIIIYILAVTNVQILSWTIGYIVLSGTNAMVLTPSLVVSLICIVVFALCMLKKPLLKAISK